MLARLLADCIMSHVSQGYLDFQFELAALELSGEPKCVLDYDARANKYLNDNDAAAILEGIPHKIVSPRMYVCCMPVSRY